MAPGSGKASFEDPIEIIPVEQRANDRKVGIGAECEGGQGNCSPKLQR